MLNIVKYLIKPFQRRQLNGNSMPMNIVSIPITENRLPHQLSAFNIAVIRLRANALSTLTWNVYREQGNQRILLNPNENPVARAFWRPSQNLTTTELLSNIVFFLDVYGNAFVRVKRPKEQEFELSLLHPTQLQIDNVSYIYQNEKIPREEVLHIREPIFDWIHSRSFVALLPRTFLADANEVLNSLLRFVARFTEKNGVPPIYFSGATLTPEQQARVVQQWNALYPDFPLRTFIESGRIESLPISLSFNIDALPDVSKVPMQTIASFYGVPLGKITGENANYATAMINDYTFWTTSVKPTALLIQDALTDYFRRFDNTILISFEDVDFSVFEMFKETPNIETKSIYAPDPNITWKALDKIARDIAKTFEPPFQDFWLDFEKYITQKTTTRAFTNVTVEINVDEIFALLTQYLHEPLTAGIKRSIRHAFAEINKTPPSVGYEIVHAKAQQFTEQQLSNWVENWTRQLTQEIESAQDPPELASKVERFFSKISKYRIQTQARQLATATLNVSLTETFSLFPEYDVVWLSQRDGQVRPAHVLADGQKRQNGYFSVGGELLPFPAGGTLPENNINCRCYIRPVRRQ